MGNTFKTGNYVNAIFQDASNNVGIGAAPSGSYKLEVTGTAKVSGILTLGSTLSNGTYAYTLPSATGTLALTSAIPANPVGGTGTTNYISKFTGASTIGNSLIFDNGTNVGIGNTNTTYKLEVTGTAKISTSLLVNDISISSSTMQASGNYYIGCNNANFIQFYTSNTDRMAITAAGNVGIGTTSPDNLLVVSGGTGSMKLEATTTNRSAIQIFNTANTLYLGVDNASASYFGYTANSANIQTLNYPIIFSNGSGAPLERMRITSAGLVGIGTNNPPKLLTLYSAGSTFLRFQSGAATTDHWDAESNTSARFYISNVSSGNGAYLVYNSASGWTGVSDARWKTDWTSIDGSLDLINRLNIGKYKMLNNDKEVIENARWDYGIKAQELLDIIPDAVDVPKDENDKYGVIHNIVFYNAIKAIQELSAQVQQLSKQNEELYKELNDLKALVATK